MRLLHEHTSCAYGIKILRVPLSDMVLQPSVLHKPIQRIGRTITIATF